MLWLPARRGRGQSVSGTSAAPSAPGVPESDFPLGFDSPAFGPVPVAPWRRTRQRPFFRLPLMGPASAGPARLALARNAWTQIVLWFHGRTVQTPARAGSLPALPSPRSVEGRTRSFCRRHLPLASGTGPSAVGRGGWRALSAPLPSGGLSLPRVRRLVQGPIWRVPVPALPVRYAHLWPLQTPVLPPDDRSEWEFGRRETTWGGCSPPVLVPLASPREVRIRRTMRHIPPTTLPRTGEIRVLPEFPPWVPREIRQLPWPDFLSGLDFSAFSYVWEGFPPFSPGLCPREKNEASKFCSNHARIREKIQSTREKIRKA